MISFKEGRVIENDGILDGFLVIDPITLVLKAINHIPSPCIESGSVKEPSVLITLQDPIYPGLEHPEVLLIPYNSTVFIGELLL